MDLKQYLGIGKTYDLLFEIMSIFVATLFFIDIVVNNHFGGSFYGKQPRPKEELFESKTCDIS